MKGNLIKLPEPTLRFGYDQEMEDPKDGLMLFGPLDEGRPYGIRCGVIGTRDGIGRFVRCCRDKDCESTVEAISSNCDTIALKAKPP